MNERSGFTLIELSIVLVIIGLITGGVLVGRDLIHAAEIRATISQIEQYSTAVNTFRTKYNCLPGDCPSAQAAQLGFFVLSGCSAPNGFGCGDGDGLIEDGANPNEDRGAGEAFVIWTHLSQANLISFTQAIGCVGSVSTAGILAAGIPDCTSPPAKIGRGNYVIAGSDGGYNYWAIAGEIGETTGGLYPFSDSLTPIEAYNIDTKIDDGLPNTGIVQARSAIGLNSSDQVSHSPLADLNVNNGAPYAQTPTSGNCLSGGTGSGATDTTNIYNVAIGSGGETMACELRLRWN